MKTTFLTAIIAFLFTLGCAISGHYVGSGPCKGFHTNPQACQRAADNSRAVAGVKIGQSIDEVSKIMGSGPERREATTETETWSYLTDYDGELMTTIIFRQGVVTEIKQTPWVPEQNDAKSSGGV